MTGSHRDDGNVQPRAKRVRVDDHSGSDTEEDMLMENDDDGSGGGGDADAGDDALGKQAFAWETNS